MFELKNDFNLKVLELRDRKKNIIEKHKEKSEYLEKLAKELPPDQIRNLPEVPTYVEETEYPENELMYVSPDIKFEEDDQEKHKMKFRLQEERHLDREYEALLLETAPGNIHTKFG